MKKPLVSICCTTYNHEKYIRDAIESFLMQKTTFPIEIIIHDDASTDDTAIIVKKYADKYSDLIVPILQNKNQYSQGKRPWSNYVFPKARGKYIALCEGDDYWTNPYKLQKQADFLENNPEFIMSFHKVKILKGNEILDDYITKKRIPQSRDIFDTYDLSFGNFIHTPSVVFRNVKSAYIDNKVLRESPIGDYILYLYLSLHGKIKLQNDCMAIYRVHNAGAWSQRNKNYIRIQIKHYLELLIDNFEHECKKNFTDRYVYILLGCIKMNLMKGKIGLVIQNFSHGLKRVDDFPKKLSVSFIKEMRKYFCNYLY